MKRKLNKWITICIILTLSFLLTAVTEAVARTESVIVYYDGRGSPSPSMLIVYANNNGLSRARDVMGELAFSAALRQKIDDENLQVAYSEILNLGTEIKVAKYGLVVVVVFEDGSSSKYYLDKDAANSAFESVDIDDDQSHIHHLLENI